MIEFHHNNKQLEAVFLRVTANQKSHAEWSRLW